MNPDIFLLSIFLSDFGAVSSPVGQITTSSNRWRPQHHTQPMRFFTQQTPVCPPSHDVAWAALTLHQSWWIFGSTIGYPFIAFSPTPSSRGEGNHVSRNHPTNARKGSNNYIDHADVFTPLLSMSLFGQISHLGYFPCASSWWRTSQCLLAFVGHIAVCVAFVCYYDCSTPKQSIRTKLWISPTSNNPFTANWNLEFAHFPSQLLQTSNHRVKTIQWFSPEGLLNRQKMQSLTNLPSRIRQLSYASSFLDSGPSLHLIHQHTWLYNG